MSKTQAPPKLVAFDAARYLEDDEAIAEYMTAALETNDPDSLLLALSDVARAECMAQVAKDAGLGGESLYKAFPRVHQARSGGTRYIFASPGLASCRRRPLGSNVRRHERHQLPRRRRVP